MQTIIHDTTIVTADEQCTVHYDAAIVIADEPTGNLDARNSANVLQLIADLRTETGKTFIIATHDPTVAAHADRAIRIVDGEVSALDTTGGRITQ